MHHPSHTERSVRAGRRARLAATMAARGGGVAILLTATEKIRNRDADYPFRFDSHFHYLCGFPEPESALVLVVMPDGANRTILFCRERDPERETWDGLRFGPDGAREAFGIEDARPIATLDATITTLLANCPALWVALGTDAALDERINRWLGAVRAQSRAGVSAPSQAIDVRSAIDEMRLIKDSVEIDTMRRAAIISADAHKRAMRTTRPGHFEYQVEAEILHEFRRRGSQAPAYGSIVAGGVNACILHYRENDALLRAGSLLLIDAGCELDGYASDITRTFPVDGHFTGPQRALYDIVLAAQHAAIAATVPGARFIEPHDAAVRVLTQGLIDENLIAGPVDDAIAQGTYKRFYMHRTGHWLGMDVHDVGDYREHDAPWIDTGAQADPGSAPLSAAERPWRRLQAGMVLTIEPGLYVRGADDIPAGFHDVGIRIEDDALVTATGCEILTADVPTAAQAIEALMAEARG